MRSLQTTGGDRSERTTQRLEAEALRAMVDGKPHVAVPVLRAYLRFAHATGNWGRVQDARSLLASAYQAAGVLEPAAALLILAGQAKQAAELAKRAGDRYLDVRPHLGASGASARAAAFRVLAVQGDLVPDDQVDEIAATALDVLRQERAGVLRDNPRYGPFVRLEALKVLAELADRITPEAAAELLDYLLPCVPRKSHNSHHTDDSHVRACVGIAAGHPALRVDAIGQLLDLVAANDSGVSRKAEYEAHNLFLDYPELVRDRLGTLASDGNRYAASLLSRITDEPTEVQLNAAQAASANLSATLDNTATSIGLGTDAERQALLAMSLPKEDRKNLVRIQLERVRSPYEPGWNRSDYFLAAGHLAHDLDDVDEFFEQAMEHAADSTPTAADLALNMSSDPLGPVQVSGMTLDTRPYALVLAASLARTQDQRDRVRNRAINLLGTSESSGRLVVRALRTVKPDDLARDVPLLAVQQDWAARALAGITWAAGEPNDAMIGLLLAEDRDQRVRRSLADGLRHAVTTPTIKAVQDKLRTDPRFSVRRLVGRTLDVLAGATRPPAVTDCTPSAQR
ncbi:hypothetical protein [Saccharothrix luteola]|uniref:hypothetical protein n=1 Tax=Saccharothrix luteola TaxID=2893018 RepID=UPI001E561E76|nr:hypothetical protein [Saccharothrix luteola]MCC8251191.1 hypothetical protein [Saccharothrix luteola]